jgi:hypothetical protein
MYTPVILAVSYLFTGLVRYLVDPGISHGAHKLTETPELYKKKKEGKKPKGGGTEASIASARLNLLNCHLYIWQEFASD